MIWVVSVGVMWGDLHDPDEVPPLCGAGKGPTSNSVLRGTSSCAIGLDSKDITTGITDRVMDICWWYCGAEVAHVALAIGLQLHRGSTYSKKSFAALVAPGIYVIWMGQEEFRCCGRTMDLSDLDGARRVINMTSKRRSF